MSREELTGPTALTGSRSVQRWVSFGFGEGGGGDGEEHDRYWLQRVTVVNGRPPEGLTVGCKVSRRESEGTRPPFDPTVHAPRLHLEGSMEARLSSRTAEEASLQASWQGQPWRVALLLTFTHSPAFWALPKEERAATFLRLPDAGSSAGDLLRRLVHRLYRARSRPGNGESAWDYLAYFEMLPAEVAHLREHLGEMRDRRRNPLWTHVTRESELWMTKETKAPTT